MLESWARFSYRHRWQIVVAWTAGLIALFFLNFAFGGKYASEFRVPGSEAQRAADLLHDRFPARSGDNADLVFEAPAGVNDPAVRPRIERLIEETRAIDGVASVESPYDDTRFISKDGTVARAKVVWTTESNEVKSSSLHQFLGLADNAKRDGLTVEAGGQVVARNEQPAFGSEFLGLLAAVAILLIAFGSLIAVGLPLGAAVFGLGAGFATIGLAANIATFPDFSPQFAAMIGIGVGIDYSLLIVTRYREGLHSGKSVESSVVLAVTTAGRSVILAGVVVAIAFLGLFLMGLPFVAALGTAGAIVVVFAVLVALTLIPAALSLAGRRIDSLRIPFLHTTEGVTEDSIWYRWSAAIQRHPLPYFLGAAGLLLFFALPALSMRLGFTDSGNTPTSQHSRRAYDLLTKGFGPGFNGNLIVTADLSDGGQEQLDDLVAAIGSTENVVEVSPPVTNPEGDTALITVVPGSKPQDGETKSLVHRL
ncbi:MAG TPA: MMPL family transporter, partial [Dehalococcoidia bacterium]